MPAQERTTSPRSGTSARDFYQVLNVARTASVKEIRRAYRALARKYHPDFNPGDSTAAQKFREVQEAYEVLGDAGKRKAYDYYGADFGDRIPKPATGSRPQPNPSAAKAREYGAGYAARNAGRKIYAGPSGIAHQLDRIQLAFLILVAVCVGGTLVYVMLPDPGLTEFKRAQEALRHVTSWKMQSPLIGSDKVTGEVLQEVSCPGSARIAQRIRSVVNGQISEVTYETVIIGDEKYSRSNWNSTWAHGKESSGAASVQCDYLARALDAPGMPAFGRWLTDMSSIQKQGLRGTGSDECREWRVLTPVGVSRARDAEFVCLGVKDHLPRFRGAPGSASEVRFYDWNVPNVIEPPDLAGDPRLP